MVETETTSQSQDRPAATVAGSLGAVWGVAAFAILLAYCLARLTPIALEGLAQPLRWYHWLALLLNTGLMAYYEGYRGFQRGFSPRVAARARYLAYHPEPLHILLGPLFCLGYFHTSRQRQWAVIALTLGIILLILVVGQLDQPWRGIIDAGVVVGLTWGLVSLVFFSIRALTQAEFDYSPELPAQEN